MEFKKESIFLIEITLLRWIIYNVDRWGKVDFYSKDFCFRVFVSTDWIIILFIVLTRIVLAFIPEGWKNTRKSFSSKFPHVLWGFIVTALSWLNKTEQKGLSSIPTFIPLG